MTIQSDLKKSWKRFVEEDIIDEQIRPEIAESWKRSKRLGLNPYEVQQLQPISQVEFATVLERRRELLSIARKVMTKMYTIVEGSGFLINLTDENENILEAVGDMTLLEKAGELDYSTGYKWGESMIGTNAITLCIRYDRPIQTIGAEHYLAIHHVATCSSAPIHDGNGRIIGTLNMTGLVETVNKHTLGIVAASVMNIEKQLKIAEFNRLIQDTISTIAEGLIITDADGRIKFLNKAASQVFGTQEKRIHRMEIAKVFPEINFERIQYHDKGIEDVETVLAFNKTGTNVFVTVKAMEERKRFLGFAIVLRKSEKVKRMINQAVGNEARYTFDSIITCNPTMLHMMESAKRIAKTNCNVLISGESGTGKELFAQSIHNASNREEGPFVAINCAALPRDLIESELFGYESGAFTGALKGGNPGKFELADGGTIFLDEVGELPIEVQSKLLRVLDSHKVTRIGGKHEKRLDVRVIAATNRDLYEESRLKNFRSDLYYRLNVMQFQMVPLRERREDIPLLVKYFIRNLSSEYPKKIDSISDDFLSIMQMKEWRGNIRELQNIVSRAYYLCKGNALTLECLPHWELEAENPAAVPAVQAGVIPVDEMEKQSIVHALRHNQGSVIKAAEDLKISRATIYRKLKKYDIDLNRILKE